MTWILIFTLFQGSRGLYYMGEYQTQQQCADMARSIQMSTTQQAKVTDSRCIQKPEQGQKQLHSK